MGAAERPGGHHPGADPRAGRGPGTLNVLASGLSDPAYLVADSGLVYWIDSGTGQIMDSHAAGGGPTVLASTSATPSYLAVGR
jgi:hypothetical protein